MWQLRKKTELCSDELVLNDAALYELVDMSTNQSVPEARVLPGDVIVPFAHFPAIDLIVVVQVQAAPPRRGLILVQVQSRESNPQVPILNEDALRHTMEECRKCLAGILFTPGKPIAQPTAGGAAPFVGTPWRALGEPPPCEAEDTLAMAGTCAEHTLHCPGAIARARASSDLPHIRIAVAAMQGMQQFAGPTFAHLPGWTLRYFVPVSGSGNN
jgi:hypothetical protein